MFNNLSRKINEFVSDNLHSINSKISKFIGWNKKKVVKILLAWAIWFVSPTVSKANELNDSNLVENQDKSWIIVDDKKSDWIKLGDSFIDVNKLNLLKLENKSIVDLFKQLGVKSTFENRKKVFSHFFKWEKYYGYYDQNVKYIKKTSEFIISWKSSEKLIKDSWIKKDQLVEKIEITKIEKKDEVKKSLIVVDQNKVTDNQTNSWVVLWLTIDQRFRKSIAYKKYLKLKKTNPENAERLKSETVKKLENKWGKDKNTDDYLSEDNWLTIIKNIETKKGNNAVVSPFVENKDNIKLNKDWISLASTNWTLNTDLDLKKDWVWLSIEEKWKYRLWLWLKLEWSDSQNSDAMLSASFAMLYAGNKLWTYIWIEKGTNLEQYIISEWFRIDNHKIKLSWVLLKKIMNFNFNQFWDKEIELNQSTIGLDYTYFTKNNDIIKEIVTSIIYYDVDGKDLWVIWNIIIDNNNEYDWTEVSWWIAWGSKLLADFKIALELKKDIRLDISAWVNRVKTDTLYDQLSKTETWFDYWAELQYRVNDSNKIWINHRWATNWLTESSIKYDYDHWNGLSAFLEWKHLDHKNDIKAENKIVFWLKYTWGWVKKMKTRVSRLFWNKNNNLTLDDLTPSKLITTKDIQVMNKVIWENHIVYVNKNSLWTNWYIEKNSDDTLKSVNLDTWVTNLDSIEDISDVKYLPYLSIVSNQFVRVENFKSLNSLLWMEWLASWETKVLKLKIKDNSWTYSAFELTLTKWSVEFRIVPISKNWLTSSEVDKYINGTKGINELNTEGIISWTPTITVNEWVAYSFTPTFTDADGDIPTYSIQNKPSWAIFNTTTWKLSGTPDFDSAWIFNNIIITATANWDVLNLPTFSITVNDVDRIWVLSWTPATSVNEWLVYSFTPTFTDADGDIPTYSIQNKPSWATFNTATWELTGTPDYNSAWNYNNVIITATSNWSAVNLLPFSINVNNVDRIWIISWTPTTTVDEWSVYSFTPTFTDADGDIPTYSIQNKPSWATFNTATWELTGTPDYNSAWSYNNVIITATSNWSAVNLSSFNITVNDIDLPNISSIVFSGITPNKKNQEYLGLVLEVNTDAKSIENLTATAWAITNINLIDSTHVSFDWAWASINSIFFNLTATANDNDQSTVSVRQILTN